MVVSQPASGEIPRQLEPSLRIIGIRLGEREPRYIVDQLAIGPETYPARVLFGRLQKFLRVSTWAGLFDLESVALLDPVEQVFSHHPLDSLPVLRADGVSGLQIDFSRRKLRRTGEKTKTQRND